MQRNREKRPQAGNDETREVFLDDAKTDDLDEKLMDIETADENAGEDEPAKEQE